MIQSVQKNKHRQYRALRTPISAALLLFSLCFLSSCHQEYDLESINATLSGGLKTRIMGTDGNFSTPSYTPASRGALITTENFGTYYSSFGFQAIRQDSMKTYVSATMIDKDSTGTGTNFYEHFYKPNTGGKSWPSKKNSDGTASYVPLSFFCFAGDNAFTPTVTVPSGSVSKATLTGYTIPKAVADQKDCLIGITNFVTPKVEGTGEDAKFIADAYIYFSHALTAINFEVGSITPGITIDSLTLSGVYGKGSLTATRTIGSANTSGTTEYYKKDDKATTDNEDEITWTMSGTANASYTTAVGFEIIGADDSAGRDATQQAVYDGSGKLTKHGALLDATTDESHSLILLPQKITDAKLTVKYTYKGVKYTQTADIVDYTWKRSNKYIYALNLTLQEFGFTLYTKEWVDGGDFPEEGYNW